MPVDMPSKRRLNDVHGRHISYVRMSITDRCNMRCQYCMAEDMQFLPSSDRLTTDEIISLAHKFVDRGISKIRITGGEPLVHPDIIAIAQGIGSRIGSGLEEVSLSTNGALLVRYASALFSAGIRRINISLDTLDAQTFSAITRGGKLDQVLCGIKAAQDAGISVKINMVAMCTVNPAMLLPMLDFCQTQHLGLTIIESMPIGDTGGQMASEFIAMNEFLYPIGGMQAMIPIAYHSAGPARYYRLADYPGLKIGIISAISNNFCDNCNRIRVTASGRVYMCLGKEDHVDLRAALRTDDAALIDAKIDLALRRKPARHNFEDFIGTHDAAVSRHMNVTGG